MEIQRLRGQIRTLERGNEADMLEMGAFCTRSTGERGDGGTGTDAV